MVALRGSFVALACVLRRVVVERSDKRNVKAGLKRFTDALNRT